MVGGAEAPGVVVAAAVAPGAELEVVDTPDVEVEAPAEWEVDEVQAAGTASAKAASAAGSRRRDMGGV